MPIQQLPVSIPAALLLLNWPHGQASGAPGEHPTCLGGVRGAGQVRASLASGFDFHSVSPSDLTIAVPSTPVLLVYTITAAVTRIYIDPRIACPWFAAARTAMGAAK